MFEKIDTPKTTDREQETINLGRLSDQEIEYYATYFLSESVAELSQEEIENQLKPLIIEISQRDLGEFFLISLNLPYTVSSEELETGNSSWARVYRSLFNISTSKEYKTSPEVQKIVHELENLITQNPQMMGPVAMWQIAKDVMWKKDVPSHLKSGLMGGITYALAFFNTSEYEAEVLKSLDLEHTENYAEVAHMLEAINQFWSHGHDSYAEDKVPDFYLRALRKIKETPKTNYLLSLRAREILSTLEGSEIFPNTKTDIKPFELSKGIYASTQVDEGLTIAPKEAAGHIIKNMTDFDANEEKGNPPQWMIDRAIANGESWIRWQAPDEIRNERERLFDEMHRFATIRIEEKLGELNNVDLEKKQELLFDYEYLVSRPIREMIQREFDFELKNLSIREQFYFLNFLKRVSVADSETMKKFTSLYGVDGMRTFLSLERGDENLGNHIVAFGQHDEVAGTVFRYYSDLLNSADRAEELVRNTSNCEGDICTDLANQVRENILSRAQKDLEKAVRAHDPSEVTAQIENYVAAAKEYVALLQEVGTGKIESVSPESLTSEERVRMQELLRKNYDKTYPEPENNEFKAAVAGSLVKSFSNPNTTYRVLRDQGKIVSFNRFDTLRDYTGKEVSYFGSFNADPAYSGVGGIMLEETIKDQLENGRPMMAHCDPTQAITKKYIEDGFVATGFYLLAGKPSFEIWCSKDSTRQLDSKQKSIEELLTPAEDTGSIVVREQSSSETYPELQKNMGLTRYFTNQGKSYLVFEKLNDTLRGEFTPPQEDLKKAA